MEKMVSMVRGSHEESLDRAKMSLRMEIESSIRELGRQLELLSKDGGMPHAYFVQNLATNLGNAHNTALRHEAALSGFNAAHAAHTFVA